MLRLCLTLFLLSESKSMDEEVIKKNQKDIAKFQYSTYLPVQPALNEMKHLAVFGDAEQRGPLWYDFSTDESEPASYLDSTSGASGDSSVSSDVSASKSSSNQASSVETDASHQVAKLSRSCTPCPHDMLKKHTNIGINWICGAYQRARRTFKSVCMMRYRNCEDGTMFTKISDHRCKNDTYHGRHWFYVYRA